MHVMSALSNPMPAEKACPARVSTNPAGSYLTQIAAVRDSVPTGSHITEVESMCSLVAAGVAVSDLACTAIPAIFEPSSTRSRANQHAKGHFAGNPWPVRVVAPFGCAHFMHNVVNDNVEGSIVHVKDGENRHMRPRDWPRSRGVRQCLATSTIR